MLERREFVSAIGALPLTLLASAAIAGSGESMSRAACKEVICAAKLEGQLKAIEGLKSMSVIPLTESQVIRINAALDDCSAVIDQVFLEVIGE